MKENIYKIYFLISPRTSILYLLLLLLDISILKHYQIIITQAYTYDFVAEIRSGIMHIHSVSSVIISTPISFIGTQNLVRGLITITPKIFSALQAGKHGDGGKRVI
jgi:hypothetical protein